MMCTLTGDLEMIVSPTAANIENCNVRFWDIFHQFRTVRAVVIFGYLCFFEGAMMFVVRVLSVSVL